MYSYMNSFRRWYKMRRDINMMQEDDTNDDKLQGKYKKLCS